MEPEELYDGVSQLGIILTELIEFGFTFATSLLECLSDADEQVFWVGNFCDSLSSLKNSKSFQRFRRFPCIFRCLLPFSRKKKLIKFSIRKKILKKFSKSYKNFPEIKKRKKKENSNP